MALPAGLLAGTTGAGGIFCIRSNGRGGQQVIDVLDPESEPPAAIGRSPSSYTWPVWVSGREAVYVSTIEFRDTARPPARLLRSSLQGADTAVLYDNPQGSNWVGANSPHYVNPAPDGTHVVFLAQAAIGGLVLLLADGAGTGAARRIARGAPLFSAWSPKSDALLLHVGGVLSLLAIDSSGSTPPARTVAGDHTAYRVPAWSPDGSAFAVVAAEGGDQTLQVLDQDGAPQRVLTQVSGFGAFAWSPDGAIIACAAARVSDQAMFLRIQLVPAAGGESVPTHVEHCIAFCWSPDGRYLAVLTPVGRGARFCWSILDRNGDEVRRFPGFRPSAEFGTYLSFFDQYALSHRLWSPDGSAILGCGRIQYNGTPPELLPSRIYSFDVESGETADVAAGSIAFWSDLAG